MLENEYLDKISQNIDNLINTTSNQIAIYWVEIQVIKMKHYLCWGIKLCFNFNAYCNLSYRMILHSIILLIYRFKIIRSISSTHQAKSKNGRSKAIIRIFAFFI